MNTTGNDALSRRERQIMDAVYRAGKATVAEVREALPDPPTYSTVRALLRVLEEKGHLKHQEDGARYVYLPTRLRQTAAKSALSKVVQTFFGGSVERTVATLLTSGEAKLSEDEYRRLATLIEEARQQTETTDAVQTTDTNEEETAH
jgi:predicted transcriptional regulator